MGGKSESKPRCMPSDSTYGLLVLGLVGFWGGSLGGGIGSVGGLLGFFLNSFL